MGQAGTVIGSPLMPLGEIALGALASASAPWPLAALVGGAIAFVVAALVVVALLAGRGRRRGGADRLARVARAPASSRRTAEARILLLELDNDPDGAVARRLEAALIRRLSAGASVAAGGASPIKAGRGPDEEMRRAWAAAAKARAGLVVWGVVAADVVRLRLVAAGGASEAYSIQADVAPPFDAALAALAGAAALDSGVFPNIVAPTAAAAEALAEALRDGAPAGVEHEARLRAATARAALALDARDRRDGALDVALSATAVSDPRADTERLEWAEAQALRAAALARALTAQPEPLLSDLEACAEAWRAAFEVWTALGAGARMARDEVALFSAMLEAADRDGDPRGLERVESLAAAAQARREAAGDVLDAGALVAILGGARLRLGEREPRTARLEAAERDLRRALVQAEAAGRAERAATIRDELARALARLGERDRGTERLRAAAVILRFGLADARRPELARARARAVLGRTLVHVGERDRDVGAVDEAVRALRTASNGFASSGAPQAAAQARRALERAERLYAELRAARASATADSDR
jgi:hypothetical protein